MNDLKIGVFVCHCGANIGGVVNVPEVAEYASSLKDVVCARHNLYTCSDAGLREIKESIKEYNLNRVVVASCTPRTHERLFRSACEEAGLNKFLFEFVNIRDQCSWVHIQAPVKATEKAKDLVRMGIAKSRLLEPMEEIEIDVLPTAMVIGGGIAGMVSAKSFADMGISTYLIEKEPQLGGLLNKLYALYPSHVKAEEFVAPVKETVLHHPKIEVLTSAQIKSVHGFIGSYDVEVEKTRDMRHETQDMRHETRDMRHESFKSEVSSLESQVLSLVSIKVGAIVVATGAEVLIPEGKYGYRSVEQRAKSEELRVESVEQGAESKEQELPALSSKLYALRSKLDVITQLEFEQILADKQRCADIKNVVMIQCVGARSEERGYCSRVCCTAAVKNSVLLKEANPDAQVFVLFRDIQTYTADFEDYYFGARDKGVIFIKYSEDRPPEVTDSIVRVYDQLLGIQLGIPYDLLVLSTPLVPRDGAKELATMLKVPLDGNGFFLEAHVKLRPVDFATDGIYLAGCARWPAHVGEVISQAQAAASRAAIPLLNGHVRAEPIVSRVNRELCIGCELCESLCPFKAIQVEMTELGRKAHVVTASCKGCGACGAACPQRAITMQHFTDAQIEAQIDSVLSF